MLLGCIVLIYNGSMPCPNVSESLNDSIPQRMEGKVDIPQVLSDILD